MKTPTEKAEAYATFEADGKIFVGHVKFEAYMKGHTEGRREALEMAQGLVEAMNAAKPIVEGVNSIVSGQKRAYKLISEALAEFEAWREGK